LFEGMAGVWNKHLHKILKLFRKLKSILASETKRMDLAVNQFSSNNGIHKVCQRT
jgi:hypothetical protein